MNYYKECIGRDVEGSSHGLSHVWPERSNMKNLSQDSKWVPLM